MRRLKRAGILVAGLVMAAVSPPLGAQAPAAAAAALGVARHTAADTRFMQGMIGHHAQAMVMATMAPTNGASPQVALFARKIFQSQRDEIDLMQAWLRDHGETVPDPRDPHAGMDMSMPGHMMLMPGMLTAEQLAQLDSARGASFDRLFLTLMIQHHRGALTMVEELFATPGSGQEAELFGYATGVDADQRAEIGRMQGMLAAMRP